MAIYITEYARLGLTTRGGVMAPEEPAIRTTLVTPAAAGAATSIQLQRTTRYVRIQGDTAASNAYFGFTINRSSTAPAINPTLPAAGASATANYSRLVSNNTEYFAVDAPPQVGNNHCHVLQLTV
jgi:hypothetical protein